MSEASRVSWAPIVAVTVGTGAIPVPSVDSINRVVLDTFIADLKKKDYAYRSEAAEELDRQREFLLARVRKNDDDTVSAIRSAAPGKISTVKNYRESIIRDKVQLIQFENRLRLTEIADKRRKSNLSRLSRIDPELASTDLAEIADLLETQAQEALKEQIGRDRIVLAGLLYRLEYNAVDDKEFSKILEDVIQQLTEAHRAFRINLTQDMAVSAKEVLALIEVTDRKFRSSLAVKMTMQSDFSPDVLVKTRDRQRDLIILPLRGKKDEFVTAYEAHALQNQEAVKKFTETCIICYGYPRYFQFYFSVCHGVPNTCDILECLADDE